MRDIGRTSGRPTRGTKSTASTPSRRTRATARKGVVFKEKVRSKENTKSWQTGGNQANVKGWCGIGGKGGQRQTRREGQKQRKRLHRKSATLVASGAIHSMGVPTPRRDTWATRRGGGRAHTSAESHMSMNSRELGSLEKDAESEQNFRWLCALSPFQTEALGRDLEHDGMMLQTSSPRSLRR